MKWHKAFDTRQLQEIELNRIYKNKFSHGTGGHLPRIIIAQFAEILDKIEDVSALENVIYQDDSA